MLASEASASESDSTYVAQQVGGSAYLARHNAQMFEEGRSFSGNERDKLWFNRGDGSFADVSSLSGADSPNDGRAVIAADFDDDGDVDLFVHNIQRERHGLYRNELGSLYGGFVKVRLRATESQYEAIGAVVRVTGAAGPQAQVLSRGAGYSSCQAPELVFGVGGAREAAVEVRWPGGTVESFGTVPADSRVLLVEGAGESVPFEAKPAPLPDPLPAGLKVAVGERIPPFAMLRGDAETTVVVDAAALTDGKRLYLNFWASYCASCVKELPILQQLEDSGAARVIGLSMDAPADTHYAQDLFTRRGARFPSYFIGATKGPGDEFAVLADIVDLERLPIPTTIVVGPDGLIEDVIRGPVAGE